MRRHQDWSTPAFRLPSVAEAVGPFVDPRFLRAAVETTGEAWSIVESERAIMVVSSGGGRMALAGDPDLTDYRSPRGEGVDDLVAEVAAGCRPGTCIDLDSLPQEAAEPMAKGMEAAGVPVEASRHAVSAVLALPDDFDAYLSGLDKKQRHELRRKRRRYEAAVGEVRHSAHRGIGWGFDEFIRLHRLAGGDKGRFMTSSRRSFFTRLAETPGWRTDLLAVPGADRAAACAFGYADREGYFLYNSSYDPALAEASPGMVLLGALIESAIADGLPRFDFLKGDEPYKLRLGAEERPLYRLRGVVR